MFLQPKPSSSGFNPNLQTNPIARSYPALVGFGFVWCAQVATAEVAMTDQKTLLLHAAANQKDEHSSADKTQRSFLTSGSVALEARHYLDQRQVGSHKGGFVSGRLSAAGNIGVGIGYRDPRASWWSSRFGITYNGHTGEMRPFIGFSLDYTL